MSDDGVPVAALPTPLALGAVPLTIDRAVRGDVAGIVRLLHEDPLGTSREDKDLAPYLRAFEAVDGDADQLLVVVRTGDGDIVGTMQLTFTPGLSRSGTTRMTIEAVRVGPAIRGRGLGTAMMRWASDYGAARGATLAQLTSDVRRADAHRFYERLGWVASHVGLKRDLH